MKRFLLTAMSVFTIACSAVFGMYGYDGDSWIEFLTDGNQFRARMDQLGFVLGNDTIKGTFGLRADTGWMGQIIGVSPNTSADAFIPTVSAGIGYTSEMFGIGVGYNFTYIDGSLQIHTPVLMINALNNNFKLVVPIEIAMTDNAQSLGPNGEPNPTKIKFTGIGFNNLELRYNTGIDAFNEIRFYASYRNTAHEGSLNGNAFKFVSEALDLQLRLYFLNTTVGNVGINPFLKVQYSTALKGSRLGDFLMTDSYKYPIGINDPDTGHDGNASLNANTKQSDVYSANAYELTIAPVLALSANSDIVSLYFEPSLGYTVAGDAPLKSENRKQTLTHALYWGAYAELYVTPVEDLEWYFEMDVNGDVTGSGAVANVNLLPVYFETTTGITWYLPSFGTEE